MRTTGTWLGEYTYGAHFYGAAAGKSVPFHLSLTESWLGRFTGHVCDDASQGGMPELGSVVGRRRGATVELIKTMPVSYMTEPSGALIETKAWILREYGIEDPRLEPHRIHYAGRFDEDGDGMRGTWRIWNRVDHPNGESVQMTVGVGTWSARRIAARPRAI
jgi:hypothetical protein